MLEELVMEKELTKYDRTTAIHSIAVVTDFLNSKDKEFMQYYNKYKEEIKGIIKIKQEIYIISMNSIEKKESLVLINRTLSGAQHQAMSPC